MTIALAIIGFGLFVTFVLWVTRPPKMKPLPPIVYANNRSDIANDYRHETLVPGPEQEW